MRLLLQATESWVGPENEGVYLSHLHDRIHYPLALPYTGKPDPVLLQATIRTLRTELERGRKQVLQVHTMHSWRSLVMVCASCCRDKSLLHYIDYRKSKSALPVVLIYDSL